MQGDGFIFIQSFLDNVFLVQSVRTGDSYVNKILRDESSGEEPRPAVIRFSTTPAATQQLPSPVNIGGVARSYFQELVLWKRVWDDRGIDTYSMYFRYCNGGTLEQLIGTYNKKLRRIPESFIRHVLARLIESLYYSDAASYLEPNKIMSETGNLAGIFHGDVFAKNIYINYPHRNSDDVPAG
ncbi:hypothetical protein F4780DRAFT_707335 [Xylariomycetidae sp. FL0641]|nr:hypothetical protein F4780DRAFT_707335 [Xylariomycetidae sp. FL0641]